MMDVWVEKDYPGKCQHYDKCILSKIDHPDWCCAIDHLVGYVTGDVRIAGPAEWHRMIVWEAIEPEAFRSFMQLYVSAMRTE